MDLSEYFETDDGSLPEIEIAFSDSSLMPRAFKHLYDRGAKNVTPSGGHLWVKSSQSDLPFSGTDDALLVESGAAEPFHVLLGGISGSECEIPDLGVFVFRDSLAFDYRMGPAWGPRQIKSLLELLRQIRRLGGAISVPWWGVNGEHDFGAAIDGG